jgi:hypothetical protein
MIYMVECSFTDPQCEQEWSNYYSGPKLDQVLSVPGFKTSQRFKAVDDKPCPYLAMHTVTSLSVLEGQNYKGGGGGSFGPWQSFITDWRRSFYSQSDEAPDIPLGSHFAVTDLTPTEVQALDLPFLWLRAAGLEATPQRGLARLTNDQTKALIANTPSGLRIYTPLMARRSELPNKAKQ